jgi:methyl-accepting chemotaxis protein
MRYPHLGYIVITTAKPVVIMHPMLPDLRDKDVSAYKGCRGFFEMSGFGLIRNV